MDALKELVKKNQEYEFKRKQRSRQFQIQLAFTLTPLAIYFSLFFFLPIDRYDHGDPSLSETATMVWLLAIIVVGGIGALILVGGISIIAWLYIIAYQVKSKVTLPTLLIYILTIAGSSLFFIIGKELDLFINQHSAIFSGFFRAEHGTLSDKLAAPLRVLSTSGLSWIIGIVAGLYFIISAQLASLPGKAKGHARKIILYRQEAKYGKYQKASSGGARQT